MRTTYERTFLLKKLKAHLQIPHPPIQVLLGPRQVGKTTLISSFLEQWDGPTVYQTADQLSPPDVGWIVAQWEQARRTMISRPHGGGRRGVLVFDEIQKIPRWSEVVKKCYDEDVRTHRSLHVILLGSSSLLVQRGLTESLAGRFEVIPVPHWSFAECRAAFGLTFEDYVFYGGYPGALRLLIEAHHDTTRWGEYVRTSLVETVLSKDILLLTPVTKPALFRQVFHLSCAHAGEVLSFNKMLGQLHEAGNASTIASYLRLLDAAMLFKPLERFAGTRLRQKVSSPKLLVLNTALLNATLSRTFAHVRRDPTVWGRLLENVVGASLINNNLGSGMELLYFREREMEVDFVVRYQEQVLAIEVKTDGQRHGPPEGLTHFLKRYPTARALVTAPRGGDIPIEELITLSIHDLVAALPHRSHV